MTRSARSSIHQLYAWVRSSRHGIKRRVATLDNGCVPRRIPVGGHHSKVQQHKTERAAAVLSRWRAHRPTDFFARWKRPVEQEGRGLSATGCGSDLARVTSASSAPIPAPTPSCSPVDSLRTGGREVPYAVPQTPRLGCRRRDGIESRLTGRYNGHSSDKNPIETHSRSQAPAVCGFKRRRSMG